jgi:aspartate carbamoyltransferase catalytic subunit
LAGSVYPPGGGATTTLAGLPAPPELARFVTISDLDVAQATRLLDCAAAIADRLEAGPATELGGLLAGRTLLLAFFENSTRTRASFELAGKRLGMHTVSLDIERSSVSKGESLLDTLLTLDAMRPEAMVIRHGSSGTAKLADRRVRAAVINAGSGVRSHPTQALLDALVIRRLAMPRLGLSPADPARPLAGVRVSIVGDTVRSRVARSNIELFGMLGAEVTLIGPPAFLPDRFRELGVRVCRTLAEGLAPEPHIVYALRVQHERTPPPGVPGVDDYAKHFCISESVLDEHCPGALVMHPGPVNRGVDLTPGVLEGQRSLVLEQVFAGVAVRVAVLLALLWRQSTAGAASDG